MGVAPTVGETDSWSWLMALAGWFIAGLEKKLVQSYSILFLTWCFNAQHEQLIDFVLYLAPKLPKILITLHVNNLWSHSSILTLFR